MKTEARCELIAFVVLVALTGCGGNGGGGGGGDDELSECTPTEPTPDWTAGDLDLSEPGTSRPAPGDGDFELCGSGAGFGAREDGYRYLIQRNESDFEFVATLTSLSNGGMGGIVARWDERTPSAAYVGIIVSRRGDTIRVQSAIRNNNDDISDTSGTSAQDVSLPVTLRIERIGGRFITSYATGGPFTTHLDVDASGDDLDRAVLATGMMQATETSGEVTAAVFENPHLVTPDGVPPIPDACVDSFAVPVQGGTPVTIDGQFLSGVRSARVGRTPLSIVARDDEAITFEMPSSQRAQQGRVILDSDFGEIEVGTALLWTGTPFVRGDLNSDGVVDEDDLEVLRSGSTRSSTCPAAFDVNNDLRIDDEDVQQLTTFVETDDNPPASPFPDAALPPRESLTCGLPEPPVITGLLRASGQRLVETALAQGDELTITGQGFPADAERTLVRFGNVRAQVLPDSDAEQLHVRILEVPDGGVKCPVIMERLSPARRGSPVGSEPALGSDFVHAYGLSPETEQSEWCPEFVASPLEFATSAGWDTEREGLFLALDRASWDPTRPLQVNLALYGPIANGLSRGARTVSLRFYDQSFDGETTPSYEEWLQTLAARLNEELNGGAAGNDCGCDARAEAQPEDEGIVLDFCDPTLAIPEQGLCCDPPPDPGVRLKALPPPISQADAFAPIESSCTTAPGDFETSPRQWAWCNFEKAVRPQSGGLPAWEWFVPDGHVLAEDHSPPAPGNRAPSLKSIMFNEPAFWEAQDGGYTSAPAIAARRYYCNSGLADWMPSFSPPARVVKTFWRSQSKLPENGHPDEYYSYQPPQGERQYLVGMHLGIGTGDHDYWRWTTFWVPRPSGDTLTKDGSPLQYNESCDVGTPADNPAEITGVWSNYAMCTQHSAGEENCGNPWAPPNECRLDLFGSCDDCHRGTGSVALDGGVLPEMAIAWLPSMVRAAEITIWYDHIVTLNDVLEVEYLKHLAPQECQ